MEPKDEPKDKKTLDLAHLERLLAEATPGKWGQHGEWVVDDREPPHVAQCVRRRHAALIVAAVNALPTLIAAARERDGWQRAAESQNKQWSRKCEEVTELRAEADALRAEVAKLRAVVEAARLLFATLNADEAGIWQRIEASGEEYPDVDEAMMRVSAALAALDGKEGTL